jgi:hypothetical protein
MSKVSKAKEIYKEYLAWFERLAQTPDGVEELRKRKAFSKYADRQAKPEPYPFQLWYLYDRNSGVDEAKMAKRADFLKKKNRYSISEANKHVGGNINNPLLNPEYVARAEATKKLREQYKVYAGGYAEDAVLNLRKEHGDLLKVATKPQTDSSKGPIQTIPFRKGLFKRIWDWFVTPDYGKVGPGWKEWRDKNDAR